MCVLVCHLSAHAHMCTAWQYCVSILYGVYVDKIRVVQSSLPGCARATVWLGYHILAMRRDLELGQDDSHVGEDRRVRQRDRGVEAVRRTSRALLCCQRNDSDEKKRAVLLTLIGPATYKLLSNLIAPQKPGEVEYSSLVKTLADHFSPTPSEIVQRFKFNSRSRRQGESVATFVAELRAIAAWCNFGETLEAMLRDRIVCGINDSTIQKRLLAESKLTYQQALDLARGLETAAKNVKELRTPSVVHIGLLSGQVTLHWRVLESLPYPTQYIG